jgi:hypothetical protein
MKWLSRFIVFAVASSGPGVEAQDVPSQARADLAPTASLELLSCPYPTSRSAIKTQEISRT